MTRGGNFVIEVEISGSGGTMHARALVDTGSSRSFISKKKLLKSRLKSAESL